MATFQAKTESVPGSKRKKRPRLQNHLQTVQWLLLHLTPLSWCMLCSESNGIGKRDKKSSERKGKQSVWFFLFTYNHIIQTKKSRSKRDQYHTIQMTFQVCSDALIATSADFRVIHPQSTRCPPYPPNECVATHSPLLGCIVSSLPYTKLVHLQRTLQSYNDQAFKNLANSHIDEPTILERIRMKVVKPGTEKFVAKVCVVLFNSFVPTIARVASNRCSSADGRIQESSLVTARTSPTYMYTLVTIILSLHKTNTIHHIGI